jgi:hypothetical protein
LVSGVGFEVAHQVKIMGPPISYVVRWMALVVGNMHVAGAAGRSLSVSCRVAKSVLEVRKIMSPAVTSRSTPK